LIIFIIIIIIIIIRITIINFWKPAAYLFRREQRDDPRLTITIPLVIVSNIDAAQGAVSLGHRGLCPFIRGLYKALRLLQRLLKMEVGLLKIYLIRTD
jgi:hypothetical protein